MVERTIPHEGRGTLENQRILVGKVVIPIPLIYYQLYDMEFYGEEDFFTTTNIYSLKVVRITNFVMGHQTLLNYCYGHPKTHP